MIQDANVEREHYDAQGGEAMASLFAAVPIWGVGEREKIRWKDTNSFHRHHIGGQLGIIYTPYMVVKRIREKNVDAKIDQLNQLELCR